MELRVHRKLATSLPAIAFLAVALTAPAGGMTLSMRPTVVLILVTLGVFILIINALMLKFVGEIVPCFEVPGFWRAFWGAIIISIVSWIMSAFFRGTDGRVHVLTHHTQIRRVRGRVIDPDDRG